jgi:hypothetical protein
LRVNELQAEISARKIRTKARIFQLFHFSCQLLIGSSQTLAKSSRIFSRSCREPGRRKAEGRRKKAEVRHNRSASDSDPPAFDLNLLAYTSEQPAFGFDFPGFAGFVEIVLCHRDTGSTERRQKAKQRTFFHLSVALCRGGKIQLQTLNAELRKGPSPRPSPVRRERENGRRRVEERALNVKCLQTENLQPVTCNLQPAIATCNL